MRVLHGILNKTLPGVLTTIKHNDLLKFSFKADPNYYGLAGGTYNVKCISIVEWSFNDTKYNFDVDSKEIKHVEIIASKDVIHVCRIYDRGYVHLDCRVLDNKYWFKKIKSSKVQLLFKNV